jgi:putative ABC transport system permease protein
MATFWLDLKHGLRMLARAPGFAIMAIVTLGLGVAAATAIFTVVNGVLLQPLPFQQPDRLVQMFETNQRTDQFSTSEPTFLDMRTQTKAFADVAAFRYDNRNLESDGDPQQLSVAATSTNLFALLGVAPALGSGFLPDDDVPAHPAPHIVLTDGLWRSRFGARRDIIGHTIRLDDQVYTVVGVMPPRFDYPGGGVVAWTPLGADPASRRADHRLTPIARLKPGVTMAQTRDDLNALAQRLGQLYPDSNRNWGMRAIPLLESIVGPPVARTVWILWAAVMLLLAMACVNVANLLMAKATTRQHEVTVRAALGASRARIARQLVTESLPLSLAGGLLGVALAWVGVAVLRRLGTENVPRLDEIAIDGRVLAFAAATAVGSAIVFGMAPMLQLSSSELRAAIGSGGRTTAGRARRRAIGGLVALQMALALVLLVGAGLMMKSFIALGRVDPGFRTDHMLAVRVALSPTQYKPEQMVALYRRLDAELQTLPGVDAAGGISIAPELDGNAYTRFLVSGRVQDDNEFLMANWRSPTPGVFRALGIPLLRGRMETDADYDPNQRVALVNATAAKRFWPDRDPIGQIVTPYARKELHYTVVGVVGDVRDVSLDTPPDAAVYLCGRSWPAMTFLAHTHGDPMALAAAVRERVHTVGPSIPFTLTTLEKGLATSIAQQRFAGTVLAIFSWVALTLAMMGIFSVISFSVAQQTREIGIRMALGAQRRDVLFMVLRRGLVLAGAGIVVGVAGALACTRVLSSLLFAVRPTDPGVFAAVTLLLGLVAIGASWLAARRALRVDPMVALRYE